MRDEWLLPVDTKADWRNDKCDKYDYLIAAFCGGIAGVIDVLFVASPVDGLLVKQVDKAADQLVIRSAQLFWKGDKRAAGKMRRMPETLEQAISYLEQAFPVGYNARYAKDLRVQPGTLEGMTSRNHHLLSLAHSPSPIGLLFSIIDQFTGEATFVDRGKLVRVVPEKTSGAIPYLKGSNLPSKLFCGFVNWIGHLISDLVGASSTRRAGSTGRGMGIPMPFYELFTFCNFGELQTEAGKKTVAEVMIKCFEEGYDLRFGVSMAIPVLVEELMIRVLWVIKRRFFEKREWRACIPTNDHPDLRIMLIVGNATLCIIDGVDAAIESGGSAVLFVCRMNLVAWARLLLLVFRELKIRYGASVDEVVMGFLANIGLADQYALKQYYQRLNTLNRAMEEQLRIFIENVDREYQLFLANVESVMLEEKGTPAERARRSVQVAAKYGVSSNRIIHNIDELDAWIKGKR